MGSVAGVVLICLFGVDVMEWGPAGMHGNALQAATDWCSTRYLGGGPPLDLPSQNRRNKRNRRNRSNRSMPRPPLSGTTALSRAMHAGPTSARQLFCSYSSFLSPSYTIVTSSCATCLAAAAE